MVGDQQIEQSSCGRNVGVLYDQHLSMIQHVNSVCRTGHCHLRNIGRISRYLFHGVAKTLVHALVTSRIDDCNSFLHDLPMTLLEKTSAEYMCAYRYKDQSPCTRHTRSERATPATSPLYTAQDTVLHLPCYPPPSTGLSQWPAVHIQTDELIAI